jgi:hypothetical protein
MKRIKFYLGVFFTIASTGLFLAGCQSNNDGSGTSRVTVRMVDATGDYQEVNVEVLDVLIKDNSDTDDQGWVSIGDPQQVGEGKIYNLLDLTGGVNVLLADNLVPPGKLGQIRLLLGDDNTVKIGVETYDLKTPSAQQSGLKLKVNQTLEEGKSYEFLLDFDVKQSVVKAGNSGIYNLHPVIRVSTKENTGGIEGLISGDPPFPADFAVSVSIPVEGGTISSSMNLETGEFLLSGVPAGTYTVTLEPGANSEYAAKTIEDVVVVNEVIKDVGNQTLVLK